ncbi:MAG: response regulator [Vicinamibacterales bacterium]|nr:response regulator [Vicinamibacterales bacterium]
MRILIVDDEADIVDMLAGVCRQDGHEVTACTRSLDALNHVDREPVDLLITDISMPAPDGLELVRLARAKYPDLMAIVITGYAARYPLDEVLGAGASDLLLKPFRMEELRLRVGLAASRLQTIASLRAQQRGLQEISTEMIRGLQNELELARRLAPHPGDAASTAGR